MDKALALIIEYGSHFKAVRTSKVEIEELRIGFKDLGYKCRVTPLGSDIQAIRRGFREYQISWWLENK